MHDTILQSDWDTLLYAVPLMLALLIGFFRLDEHISSSRKTKARRTFCDINGEPLFSDPDGRPWKPRDRIVKNAPAHVSMQLHR